LGLIARLLSISAYCLCLRSGLQTRDAVSGLMSVRRAQHPIGMSQFKRGHSGSRVCGGTDQYALEALAPKEGRVIWRLVLGAGLFFCAANSPVVEYWAQDALPSGWQSG
jgi:hypothetical protein